jgi:hypothetical protein
MSSAPAKVQLCDIGESFMFRFRSISCALLETVFAVSPLAYFLGDVWLWHKFFESERA